MSSWWARGLEPFGVKAPSLQCRVASGPFSKWGPPGCWFGAEGQWPLIGQQLKPLMLWTCFLQVPPVLPIPQHPPGRARSLSLSLTTGSQRWPVLLILCLFNFLFPMPSLTWLGPYRQQLDESSNQLLSPPLANPSPQSLEHQLHNSGELPNPPAAERLSRTCTFLTFCLFLTSCGGVVPTALPCLTEHLLKYLNKLMPFLPYHPSIHFRSLLRGL